MKCVANVVLYSAIHIACGSIVDVCTLCSSSIVHLGH